MAAKKEPGQFILDGLGALDAGMNAGLVPQLLPPNQVAMSTNMTFRGGYGTHRPPIREISLTFPDGFNPETFIRQPFQGACFYQPDSGNQSIVTSIGGKLFQIFPSGTTANVLDISIPGDFNSSTPQQAWLWQCERFVIVNDGVSLPIFFDGNTSRRSNGPNKVLATLAGTFTIPAVGSTVTATVTVPYTGPINISVLINGAQFTLTRASGTVNPDAHLQYLFGPLKTDGHSLVNGNVPIVSYPNRLGSTLRDIPAGTVDITGTTHNGIRVFTTELYDANANPILPPGLASNLNIPIQIGNEAFVIVGCTRSFNPNTGSFTGNPTLIMNLVKTFPTQKATTTDHPSGSIITIVSAQPTVTLGVTGGPFVVASQNDIFTAPIWTYPKQIVWIEDTQFIITPIPNPIVNTITLVNVTGTPGNTASGDISALPELPAGRMGVYGMGRNWMALTDGTGFIASDIVGGSSGTAVYNLRDAPLRVTENSLLAGGGTFRVPGAVGDIRAMRFSATLDVSLGQGPLQVFTTMAAFSCDAPVDRTTWSNVQNPILTQSLIGAGALSQSSTVLANGDIVFRAVDGIRSLILARREFDTWGNVPQSREVESILAQDNPTLTQFESAAVIENRLLMTVLPTNGPLGVFCQGIIALNFDPISTLRGKSPSIYDGIWTGMNILQLVQGVFNGVDRCYALCFDGVTSRIRLFEIQKTADNPFDNLVTPVTYSFESASLFTNPKLKNTFDLIELVDGEMYVSDVRGAVNVEVWYRPNYSDCWTKWTEFGICGDNTDTSKPVQYRTPIGLGSPSVQDCDPNTNQPTRIGLTFQVRFQVTGACKFRGAKFKAVAVPETRFSVAQCKPLCVALEDAESTDCEPCREQDTCLQFPLVLYNLNANKSYSNDPTTVIVQCPDGSTQTVTVPSNTINYTLPFAPGFTGEYPPLVMNCLSGGVIVKTIPSGATQEIIDGIVNSMIAECVQAYAQSIAGCGVGFLNQQVSVVHQCGVDTVLHFNGTLPVWISINTSTSSVVGSAGFISSEISVADATEKAQSQLQDWVDKELASGNLSCQSTAFALLPEPSSDTSSTLPSVSSDPPVGGAVVGGTFYLITQSGRTFTSTDGLSWSDLSGNGNTFGLTLTGMVYGGGLFVAYSSAIGSFLSSADAITWTHVQPSGGSGGGMGKLLAGIFFGGKLYIADDDDSVWTSDDWTSSDGTKYHFNTVGAAMAQIASNGTTMVAVGKTGFIFFSTGTTWTEANDGSFLNDWTGVAFGNGVFVAVGSDPRVVTSTDGNNWTTQTTIIDENLTSVAFGNGLFVATSRAKAWSSPDGVTWTLITFTSPADFGSLNNVIYLSGLKFLALEKLILPNVVLVPTESSGWSPTQTAYGFVNNGGVLYGLGDTNLYSSTDGVNFTSVSAHGISQPTSLVFGAGVFVAGTNSATNKAWSSPDGITWTSHAAGTQPIFVAFGNGKFVGIGLNNDVTTSSDGVVWALSGSIGINNPRNIAFGAGLFVSGKGIIQTSPDGITWTTRYTPSNSIWGVEFADGKFIAVGENGLILTSLDGLTWTPQTSGITDTFIGCGGGGGLLLAVTGFGTTNVYQSKDGGVTWTFLRHETNDDFPSLIYYYSGPNVIDAGFFV